MTKLTAGGAGPAMTDDRRSSRADTVCDGDWEEEQSVSMSVNEGKRKGGHLNEPPVDVFDASNEGAWPTQSWLSMDLVYNHTPRIADPTPTRHVLFSRGESIREESRSGTSKGWGGDRRQKSRHGPQESLHESETSFERVETAETSTDCSTREFEPLVSFSLPW